MSKVKKRLTRVKERIKEAASRANRDPQQIKLVAVSKGQNTDKMEQVLKEGVRDFGESRVQELRDKYDEFEEVNLNWHMIGHLQRNKVKYLARMERCKLIHSLDSLRLAEKIEDRGKKADRKLNALVQVNVAKDKNKFGIFPDEVKDYLAEVSKFDYLQIKGLMTLVPYTEDPEEVRPYFRKLRKLFTEVKEEKIPGVKMKELSMGMTNDFEVAVEEGATIVRIGRGIFGSREYK